MKRACLVILTLLTNGAMGCNDVSDAAADLTTITVGADALNAIEVERTLTLGPERLPACLNLAITLPASNTTVAMQTTNGSCTLSVGQPGLVLFDEQDIEHAREQVGSFDVDGIRSASVVLENLELSDEDGAPLALAQYVDAITVQVDGQVLLDQVQPAVLEGDAELSRQLPDSIVEKLKGSVKTNQVATADVSLTLWLHGPTLTNLPGKLKMLLVLQPKLEVNLLKAL